MIPEGGSIYSFFLPGIGEPECMMRRLSGLSCGTCGMTSAFAAIAKNKFETAIIDHSLSIPLFLGLIMLGVIALFDIAGLKKISNIWFSFYESNRRKILIGVIALFLLVYITRMIGEIQYGYYKSGGLEKILFIWFFMFRPDI